MFLIVLRHVLANINPTVCFPDHPILIFLYQLFLCTTLCAVDCYALISGFVNYSSRYRYYKFAVLWLKVVFYTIPISILIKLFASHIVSIGFKTVLCAFFPVSSSSHWYVTAYFVLFLFIPVLNSAMRAMSKSQATILVVGLFLAFCIWNPLSVGLYNSPWGYDGLTLIFFYLLGAYFRKYGFPNCLRPRMVVCIYFTSILLSALIQISFTQLNLLASGNTVRAQLLSAYQSSLLGNVSVFVVAPAVCLLYLFQKEKLACNPQIIQKLSKLTFGVYIIHVYQPMAALLSVTCFLKLQTLPDVLILPGALIMAALVFIGCSALDAMREFIFKKLRIASRLASLESKHLGNIWE